MQQEKETERYRQAVREKIKVSITMLVFLKT
jgi:hypothetical protein